jgi:hypothetical protein
VPRILVCATLVAVPLKSSDRGGLRSVNNVFLAQARLFVR